MAIALRMSAIGTKRTWHRGWLIPFSEVKRHTLRSHRPRRIGSARVEKEAEGNRDHLTIFHRVGEGRLQQR